MRKVYTATILLITMLVGAMTIAQEQKSFVNYQGVARDANGTLMANESMTIGIALKFGSASSEAAYAESHGLTTDANGVFSLKIGDGTVISGDYEELPWGEFASYATVSLNGNEIGTTELMAVPYALSSADNQWHTMGDDIENKNGGNVFITGSLYASKDFSLAEGAVINEFSTDITLGENSDEIVPTQKAIKAYVDSQAGGGSGGGTDDQTAAEVAYDNSTSGLTATTAQAAIDELVGGGTVDADSDPTNEIQILSFDTASNELNLTNGGSVTLPSGGTDADADPTNEIQDISLSGTELTISDGATIDLAPIIPPGGTDDQNAGEVAYDNTTSGLAATDTQAAIDELASGGLVDTDDQALVLTGDILTIEDGAGSVDLSAYKDNLDKTSKTGLLMGDGTDVSGLVGTADGQVAKWNAGTSTWEAAPDETAGGGSGSPTGLEALDEGNGTGWRLIGRDPNDYGNIGDNAVDLSYFDEVLPNGGATGSYALASGWNTQALGDWSTATGRQTRAEGDGSFATGWQNMALGDYSVVMGRETIASGSRSVAMGMETSAVNIAAFSMGNGTYAGGRYSSAMGINTRSDAQASFAVGKFNAGGGDPDNWVATDPLFEVGNGSGVSDRKNAFTVLKNGNVGIGETSPTAKLEVDGTIRSNDLAGVGERNVVADANGILIIGAGGGGSSLWSDNGGDIYYNSGKVGVGTNTPESSIAIETDGNQWNLTATEGDFRIGDATHRLKIGVAIDGAGAGDARIRVEGGTDRMMLGGGTNDVLTITDQNVGIGTIVPAEKLHVDGSIRSNDLSGAGERNVVADANGNLIIGAGGGGSSLWSENASDIYFNGGEVGIGTDSPSAPLDISTSNTRPLVLRSTANDNYMQYITPNGFIGYSGVWTGNRDVDFGTTNSNPTGKVHLTTNATPKLTVAANGDVGIGTIEPSAKLHIRQNSTATQPQLRLEEVGNDYARMELTNNQAVALWRIEGIGRDGGSGASNSHLKFHFRNDQGAADRFTISGNGDILVGGSVVHSSDLRLKKDVKELAYGLKEVLQLEPKTYRWLDNRNDGTKSLGLIAQAVKEIIPEIVHEENDSKRTLSLSYTELIPVMISAIKEQQKIIDQQSEKVSDLEKRLDELEDKIGF